MVFASLGLSRLVIGIGYSIENELNGHSYVLIRDHCYHGTPETDVKTTFPRLNHDRSAPFTRLLNHPSSHFYHVNG